MTRSESERIGDIFDAISAIEEAHRLLDFVPPSEEIFRVVLDAAQLWATIEKPLAQLKSELEKALGSQRDEPRMSE
jgi:uncharacterized protein with HEPN domain